MYKEIEKADPEIAALLHKEETRQFETLRLIASENYASRAVQEAVGSPLANKYSEGYSGKRYYQGQENIDGVETLAIERLKQVFGADHVNVQPYSGSPANLAVYLAFVKPGDPIMGLGLPHGGHLTHGWKVSLTGKWFDAHLYPVRRDDELLDYDAMRALAREVKPKLIFAGTTAYPRIIDWAIFREVADEVGAILVTDVAHISGLIAGGVHPSPVPYADVITSTTHKTFRGPRGGMIMCKEEHAAAIDRAIFPGLQGGPHNNTTAGIAIAAGEALKPEFSAYAQAVVDNARVLGEGLASRGYRLVTGGTDNHMLIVDLTAKGIGGKPAAIALERAGIVCNYNTIPFDPRKPFDPSGIRIGTPAMTTRGMGVDEMKKVAEWMDSAIKSADSPAALDKIRAAVTELATSFPAPGLSLS